MERPVPDTRHTRGDDCIPAPCNQGIGTHFNDSVAVFA